MVVVHGTSSECALQMYNSNSMFLLFLGDFDWPVGKIKWFLHFNKTCAYEYLISALISQC